VAFLVSLTAAGAAVEAEAVVVAHRGLPQEHIPLRWREPVFQSGVQCRTLQRSPWRWTRRQHM